MKTILQKLIISSICLLAIGGPAAAESPSNTPKILMLSSYHEDYRWAEGTIVSAASQFLLSQTENIELYIEYMDTKRVYNTEYLQLVHQTLRLKYADVKLDAIISTDDDALQFLLKNSNELFGQTPVIFCGVNNFKSSMLRGKTNFTGLVETTHPKLTIDLALKLHPQSRRVVVITDNTPTGFRHKKNIETVTKRYKVTYKNIKFEYISGKDLSTEELITTLSQLPPDSIVLLANWSRDKTDRYFSEDRGQTCFLLSSNSTAPIYGLNDSRLDHGIVGGKILSSSAHGNQATAITLQILNGKKPADIPVCIKVDNHYKFDYKQLKRWQINKDDLPEGSILINEPQSFYYRYKTQIWLVTAIITALTTIILTLSANIIYRIRINKTLTIERNLLTALIDNIPDHIYFKDTQSRFIRINKSLANYFKLKNCTEALGKTDFDFFAEKYAEQAFKNEKQIIRTAKPLINTEEKQTGPDDRQIWVSTTKMPLYDENGQTVGTFGLSRDITDHKKAQNLLAQHAEKLERFNNLAIGRDKRMDELKNQINDLLRELKRPKECYPVDEKTESPAPAQST